MGDGRHINGLLQRALEGAVEGEVRFDVVSRAIYSTHASVYQIMPAGVVIPRYKPPVRLITNPCAPSHRLRTIVET